MSQPPDADAAVLDALVRSVAGAVDIPDFAIDVLALAPVPVVAPEMTIAVSIEPPIRPRPIALPARCVR